VTARRQSSLRFLIAASLVFVLASLAMLARDHEGWQGVNEYHVTAERWQAGAPLRWLGHVDPRPGSDPGGDDRRMLEASAARARRLLHRDCAARPPIRSVGRPEPEGSGGLVT